MRSFADDTLTLAFSPEYRLAKDRITSRAAVLAELLSNLLGAKAHLVVDVGANAHEGLPLSPAERDRESAASRKNSRENRAKAHPAVRLVLSRLQGRITDIREAAPASRVDDD